MEHKSFIQNVLYIIKAYYKRINVKWVTNFSLSLLTVTAGYACVFTQRIDANVVLGVVGTSVLRSLCLSHACPSDKTKQCIADILTPQEREIALVC